MNYPDRPTVGRWHFVYWWEKDNSYHLPTERGWRRLSFGIFKLLSRPPAGCEYGPPDYRGFWINVKVWLPWEFEHHWPAPGDIEQAVAKPSREFKPPLGLRPRWIARRQRIVEISAAVKRYSEDGKPIPDEWFAELAELEADEMRSGDFMRGKRG